MIITMCFFTSIFLNFLSNLDLDGIWINFGGLNFAYDAYEETEMCIPMSLDILKKVLQNRQFAILKDELIPTTYGPQSMRNTQINSSFFTCQKK